MSFTPFVIVWGVMALIVALIIVRRIILGFNEDDSLHLAAGELPMEQQQIAKARSIEAADHWGKILTAATSVYGVVLLGAYAYKQLY